MNNWGRTLALSAIVAVLIATVSCRSEEHAPEASPSHFQFETNNATITITRYNCSVRAYLAFSDPSAPSGIKIIVTNTVDAGSMVTIPNMINGLPVTSIGDGAFFGCVGLTNVTIPAGVIKIGGGAFAYCSGLTKVSIPSSVTNIGEGMFLRCTSLKNVTIPSSVTSIGERAFWLCTTLTTVSIPSSVTEIGENAFAYCTSLAAINVNAGNKNYSSVDGLLFDKAQTTLIQLPHGHRVGSYALPASVTNLGRYEFEDFTNSSDTGQRLGDYTYSTRVVWKATSRNQISGVAEATITGFNKDYKGGLAITNTLCGFPVTGIGDNAFEECVGLTTVTIPSTVTSIGERAFRSCSGLGKITIPTSVTTIKGGAFSDCTSLPSITIPAGVTSIDYHLFYGCSGLTNVTIPASVTTIGEWAFLGSGLTSVTIPTSVISIGDGVFRCCNGLTSVTIPASVTEIGYDAFDYCKNLTIFYFEGNAPEITGPGPFVFTLGNGIGNRVGVKSLATVYYRPGATGWGNTFGGCTTAPLVGDLSQLPNALHRLGDYTYSNAVIGKLSSPSSASEIAPAMITGFNTSHQGALVITNTLGGHPVTEISDQAFRECASLTSVTIPDGITRIGNSAFSECKALTSVTIPASVTSIGKSAFYACTNLTDITIPNGVTDIRPATFGWCEGLRNVIIPVSITNIGAIAFAGCHSLTNITIHAGVSAIGEYAFAGNYQLASMTIGTNVTSLERGTFSKCTSLRSILIPASVMTIGNEVFQGCTNLTSVFFTGNAPSLGTNVFDGCIATIHYRPGTTGWGETFGGRPTAPWTGK